MPQKKILILPAIQDHVSVIKLARKRGFKVITCDNKPSNIGHQYANKSYDIDLYDYDSLIEMARIEKIDIAWGYSTDIGALAAAKVSDALGLGQIPYHVTQIMSDKSLFRNFLSDNGFNVPRFISLTSKTYDVFDSLSLPFIIKPIDRASSKGIKIVYDRNSFSEAFDYAMSSSISQKVIIEEYIQASDYQLHGDVFVEKGKVVCLGVGDHLFTYPHNGVASTGTVFPTSHNNDNLILLEKEVQRFVDLIGFNSGAINLEARLKHGKIFFIELGPRSGGNYTPELLSHVYDRDIQSDLLSIILGEDNSLGTNTTLLPRGLFILRSERKGILTSIEVDENIDVLERFDFKEIGDYVCSHSGPDNIISIFIIKSISLSELKDIFRYPYKYFKISID